MLIIIDGHPSWFGSMAAQLELQHAPAHVLHGLLLADIYAHTYDVAAIHM
jgi:hypothetical protein